MTVRVCMAIDRFYPLGGGAESHAYHLSKQLQSRGIQVVVITRQVEPDLAKFEVQEGLTIYRVPPIGLRSHFVVFVVFFTFLWALWKHRNEYDLLHTHDPRTIYLAAMIIHKLTGKPLVSKVMINGDLSWPESIRIRKTLYSELVRRVFMPKSLWYRLLKQSSAWVAISDDIRKELEECGLSHLTHSISNAIDVTRFHPVTEKEKFELRTKLNLPLNKTIIISHGRITEQKRLDLLIEAIGRVKENYLDLYVVLPGNIQFEEKGIFENLQEQITNLGLSDLIHFPGRSNFVQEYLQASDIYIISSKFEGMSNALLEAMACGLPVISTAVSGATDIIRDGQNGFIVPIGDADVIADALRKYLSDMSSATISGKNAAQTIQENYSWEQIIKKYIALYRELLTKNKLNSQIQ